MVATWDLDVARSTLRSSYATIAVIYVTREHAAIFDDDLLRNLEASIDAAWQAESMPWLEAAIAAHRERAIALIRKISTLRTNGKPATVVENESTP